MANEPELTPAEERAVVLGKIRDLLPSVLIDADEVPTVDLDLLTGLLLQRGIPYRTLNREIAYSELHMVRDEQNVQGTRANTARMKIGTEEEAGAQEAVATAEARLRALLIREQQILDQLWPVL